MDGAPGAVGELPRGRSQELMAVLMAVAATLLSSSELADIGWMSEGHATRCGPPSLHQRLLISADSRTTQKPHSSPLPCRHSDCHVQREAVVVRTQPALCPWSCSSLPTPLSLVVSPRFFSKWNTPLHSGDARRCAAAWHTPRSSTPRIHRPVRFPAFEVEHEHNSRAPERVPFDFYRIHAG